MAGLLGVGGGIIFVPALTFLLSRFGYGDAHAVHMALGTSMALIAFTGSVSAYHHLKNGNVQKELIRQWGAFILFGVLIGLWLTTFLEGDILKKIFGGIVLVLGLTTGIKAFMNKPLSPPRPFSSSLAKILSVGIGGLAALLGVGGAVLTVPLLLRQGVSMQTAVGTGAVLAASIAIPATAGYILTGLGRTDTLPPYSLGYVNFLALLAIVPFTFFLTPMGVRVARKMPERTLKKIFAAVLFLVAFKTLFA